MFVVVCLFLINEPSSCQSYCSLDLRQYKIGEDRSRMWQSLGGDRVRLRFRGGHARSWAQLGFLSCLLGPHICAGTKVNVTL